MERGLPCRVITLREDKNMHPVSLWKNLHASEGEGDGTRSALQRNLLAPDRRSRKGLPSRRLPFKHPPNCVCKFVSLSSVTVLWRSHYPKDEKVNSICPTAMSSDPRISINALSAPNGSQKWAKSGNDVSYRALSPRLANSRRQSFAKSLWMTVIRRTGRIIWESVTKFAIKLIGLPPSRAAA